MFKPKDRDDLIICNAFGQEYVSRERQVTDYDAWNKILSKLELQTRITNEKLPKDKQWSIHAPYNMGCGLGGGSWNEMFSIIEKYFKNSTVSFVIHKY